MIPLSLRERCWNEFIRRYPIGSLTKDDLRAAITTIDQWIDDNQAGFGATLTAGAPEFSTASTAPQKALLFTYVLLTRTGLL